MPISPAAKVGAATLASIAAIGVALSWLTSFTLRPAGYDFTVKFADVAGLLKGANVYYLGVKVGRVTTLAPHEAMVDVLVHIASTDSRLPANGRYKIMSMGIIGEKALEVFPPKIPTKKKGETAEPTPVPLVWVQAKDEVRGDDPARMELVMDELTDTFEEFRKTTDPEKFQALFNKTADNLYETTETVKRIGKKTESLLAGFDQTPANVNGFLRDLDRLANDANRLVGSASPTEIQAVTRDMRQLSKGLLSTYNSFFGTQQELANGKSAGELRNLISQLEGLSRSLNSTAGDPEIRSDLKDTVRNIRNLTQQVGGIAAVAQGPKAFQGFSIKPSIQGIAANTPFGTGLAANLGVQVNLANQHVNAGIEQIGEGNYFNLAIGDTRVWGPAGYHFGLVRSKIGGGVDYGFTDQITLTGQLYDPFRPTFRVGASYFPLAGSQYGLLAQWAREVQSNANYIWLGVEWRPAD